MSDAENLNNDPVTEESVEGEEKARDLREELEVASNKLVSEVERLIQEGNVRRLLIKREGEVLLEVNLTLGIAGAGAVAIFAPIPAVILAAIAALAAAFAKVTVVIERTGEPPVEQADDEAPAE